MITEVLISCDYDTQSENGINLKIYRCDDANNVCVSVIDDGGDPLLEQTFDISFEDLKNAVEKLSHKNDQRIKT